MALNGPTKKRKQKSFGKRNKQIEELLHEIPGTGAGFAVCIQHDQPGANVKLMAQGRMLTIVSALRAAGKFDKRFQQVLIMAAAKEPLQEQVDKLDAEQAKKVAAEMKRLEEGKQAEIDEKLPSANALNSGDEEEE